MAVSPHFDNKDPRFGSLVYSTIVPATIATAGNVTYTVPQILGGLVLRDTNGAVRTDTTPTAAQIAAAIQGVFVGLAFVFTIKNTSGAANTLTITPGAGITASGTMTIAQLNIKQFGMVFTNTTAGSEAATLYSLGTTIF